MTSLVISLFERLAHFCRLVSAIFIQHVIVTLTDCELFIARSPIQELTTLNIAWMGDRAKLAICSSDYHVLYKDGADQSMKVCQSFKKRDNNHKNPEKWMMTSKLTTVNFFCICGGTLNAHSTTSAKWSASELHTSALTESVWAHAIKFNHLILMIGTKTTSFAELKYAKWVLVDVVVELATKEHCYEHWVYHHKYARRQMDT
jgi:hypothetical protein